MKLYDLNARYYNPEIARFLSQDPYYNLGNRIIGPYEINVPDARSIMQATALYVYCGNSPIVLFDFNGLWEDGDENLSPQAQVYIKYYTNLWEEMDALYDSAKSDEERNSIKAEQAKIHEAADSIRALDAEGAIKGIVHNGPVYSQEKYNICWAVCQIMREEIMKDSSKWLTQEEALKKSIKLSKEQLGEKLTPEGVPAWESGGIPSGYEYGDGTSVIQPLNSAMQVMVSLARYGPLYARYNNYHDKSSKHNVEHLVLVTGVVQAPNAPMLVITHNPWGQRNIQTFHNFVTSMPGDDFKMRFEGILLPVKGK